MVTAVITLVCHLDCNGSSTFCILIPAVTKLNTWHTTGSQSSQTGLSILRVIQNLLHPTRLRSGSQTTILHSLSDQGFSLSLHSFLLSLTSTLSSSGQLRIAILIQDHHILSSMMEKLLDELSFDATSSQDRHVRIDAAYVNAQLAEAASSQDLARYVL